MTLNDLTLEELGWLRLAASQQRKKDAKGARKFGDDLDPESSLAKRMEMAPSIEKAISQRMKALRAIEGVDFPSVVEFLRSFSRSVAHEEGARDLLATRIPLHVKHYDRQRREGRDISLSRKLYLYDLYREARKTADQPEGVPRE